MKAHYYSHFIQGLFITLTLLFLSSVLYSQKLDYSINSNIIESIPDHVEIIALGDPTHQEATITSYRTDLIRKLSTNDEYKIIAIEGNIYELYNAYTRFVKDGRLLHMNKAMYGQLNSVQMDSLFAYVQEENLKGNTIKILGYDPHFSGNSFPSLVHNKLNDMDILSKEELEDFVKTCKGASNTNLLALFRNDKALRRKLVMYAMRVLQGYEPDSIDDAIFCQALTNLVSLYSDSTDVSRDDRRDVEMARNVSFIRQLFPDKKIILFGSSTHFVKSSTSIYTPFHQKDHTFLGSELHEAFDSTYYFIAYTGLSGYKWKIYNREKALERLDDNSIERRANNDLADPATFYSKNSAPEIKRTSSRYLGHHFNVMDIWKTTDMLVFIKDIKPIKIRKRI